MKSPDITVAIPTYNREGVLIDTINDALQQSHQNLEVLVIDQSLTHDTETVKAIKGIKDSRFRYYQADPPSLPAARNFALHYAKAPIVLFLDDDVRLKKDMVEYHLAAFKKDSSISAVGGRVMQKDFPIKKEVLRFDEFAISHGVFTATQADYTNTFPGGNHSIIVKDALAAGSYDTRYYYNAFREESDMSLKLTRLGKKIYYEPRAELLHLAAHSGGTRALKTYRHIYDSAPFYRNELFFTLRNARRRIKALHLKYNEYCVVPSTRQQLRRSTFFCFGVIAALWRMAFGKQIIMKERLK